MQIYGYKIQICSIWNYENEIKLTFIGSNSMMPDPLTKSIAGHKLKYFADFIMEM